MPIDYPYNYPATWPFDKATPHIVAYLDAWFWRIETDIEGHSMPNPAYVRPNGKQRLTDSEVDVVIAALDMFFDEEMARHPDHWHKTREIDHNPGFSRLDPLRRRCLVEGLESLLAEYPKPNTTPFNSEAFPVNNNLDYWFAD